MFGNDEFVLRITLLEQTPVIASSRPGRHCIRWSQAPCNLWLTHNSNKSAKYEEIIQHTILHQSELQNEYTIQLYC